MFTKNKIVEVANTRIDIEAWLENVGVDYAYSDAINVADIDMKQSLANQVRFDPTNTDWVDSYATMMKNGDIFPPVVLRRAGNKFVIIDGNNRTMARKAANIKTTDAYIVGDISPEVLQRLLVEANNRNGHRLSRPEAIQWAIKLVDNGVTRRQAATMTGLNEAAVIKEYNQQVVDRRASKFNIIGYKGLPAQTRVRLNNIQSDPVFVAAAKAATLAKMTGPQVSRLVTLVNKSVSEETQLETVDGERKRLRSQISDSMGGARKPGVSPRHQFLMHAAAITVLDPHAVINSCLNDEQFEDIGSRLGQLQDFLTDLQKVAAKKLKAAA